MTREVLFGLFTREVNCVTPAADRDLAAMTGAAPPIGFVGIVSSAVNHGRFILDLGLEVGTHLARSRDVGRRLLFRHGHEDGRESVEKGIGVSLFGVFFATGADCAGDFLVRRGEQPAGGRNKEERGKKEEDRGEPGSGSSGFHG